MQEAEQSFQVKVASIARMYRKAGYRPVASDEPGVVHLAKRRR